MQNAPFSNRMNNQYLDNAPASNDVEIEEYLVDAPG